MGINDFSYDWASLPNHLIIEGADNDGTPLLKLMLSDYVKLTSEKVNASCSTCINQYINHLKKYIDMQKTPNSDKSDYRLHEKRVPMTLEFGSDHQITNENITNEIALKLIEKFTSLGTENPVTFLFSVYPENSAKTEKKQEPKETTAQKKKRLEAEAKAKKETVEAENEVSDLENIEVIDPVIESEDMEPVIPEPFVDDEILDLEAEY